jgi:hypothetical protein
MADDNTRLDFKYELIAGELVDLVKNPDKAQEIVNRHITKAGDRAGKTAIVAAESFTPVSEEQHTHLVEQEEYTLFQESPDSSTVQLYSDVIYAGVVERGKALESDLPYRKDGGAHMFEKGLQTSENAIVAIYEDEMDLLTEDLG